MKKIRAIILALTLSASTLTVLFLNPTQASASGIAYNQRTQLLRTQPYETDHSCVSRRILLAEGFYERALFLDGYDHDALKGGITLGEGWYDWEDCLDGNGFGRYVHTQKLNPDNPNWATSTWTFEHESIEWSGIYQATWGGYLDLVG